MDKQKFDELNKSIDIVEMAKIEIVLNKLTDLPSNDEAVWRKITPIKWDPSWSAPQSKS